MKNTSDITDCGVNFHIEFQKDISNCPLKWQQNGQYALEVHRITAAMELESRKLYSSLGVDIQGLNPAVWIVLVNQPVLL